MPRARNITAKDKAPQIVIRTNAIVPNHNDASCGHRVEGARCSPLCHREGSDGPLLTNVSRTPVFLKTNSQSIAESVPTTCGRRKRVRLLESRCSGAIRQDRNPHEKQLIFPLRAGLKM